MFFLQETTDDDVVDTLFDVVDDDDDNGNSLNWHVLSLLNGLSGIVRSCVCHFSTGICAFLAPCLDVLQGFIITVHKIK